MRKILFASAAMVAAFVMYFALNRVNPAKVVTPDYDASLTD